MDINLLNTIYFLLQRFKGFSNTGMSKVLMGVHNILMSVIGAGSNSFTKYFLRFSHNLVIIIKRKVISFTLNQAYLFS